jgi:hypothetical protein
MLGWQQPFTRRRFIGTVAAGTGVALGSGLGLGAIPIPAPLSGTAWASGGAEPRPLPGGVETPFGVFIHFFPAGSANEPSEIGDFNGLVAKTRVLGAGTGTNTKTGEDFRMLSAVDMGVMQGLYIGQDKLLHRGTFAFL